MLEWTGERYLPYIDPSVCGAEIHYEHLHRYAFASQYVKNKKVLDLASGEGFGTFMLSQTAQCVVGIEIDHETIIHATKRYNKENIEFRQGSILNVPVQRKNIFDVIVCFEAIEHIKDHDTLFFEIKRLLKDDGLLIISTPNKQTYSDEHNYHNPFHQKELYYSEFCTLMGKNFLNVVILGQRFFSGSSIYPTSVKKTNLSSEFVITLENHQFSFGSDIEKVPKYFVAIASNHKIDTNEIQKSYLVDISDTEIALLNTTINKTLTQIQSLEQNITLKDASINEFASKIQSLEQNITLKDASINESASKIQSLELAVSDRNQELKIMHEDLAVMNQQLQEINNNVQTISLELLTKDRQIQEQSVRILSLERNISSIETSIVWQLTMKFHNKIIEQILPRYTKRRRLFDLGLKGMNIFYNKGWKECYISFRNYQHAKINDRKLREKNDRYQAPKEKKSSGTLEAPLEKQLDDQLQSFLSLRHKRLVFPCHESPVVSIIILTYNKAAYTLQCLESLLGNTDIPYEIILVDNRSTDETRVLLKKVDNIVQILNEENLGFILGCNKGTEKARGTYLLFLNNDTKVTEHWLSGLASTIEHFPDCGAVGGKLIWPNGKLQEAGSILWSDGSATGYGRGDDLLKPEYSYLRDVDFISGACLLVRQDLFRKLNGFDKRYIPAYYEDADLCLGIRHLGFHVIFQPDVIIYHNEFTSSSREHANRYMIENQRKFIEKWQDLLKTKSEYSPDNILQARDARQKKTILYLDDRIPASDQGSGYPRANKLLTYLGETGYRVTIFPLAETTAWQPYTSEFQQIGIEVIYGKKLNLLEFAIERRDFYDIVIVSRPHNFEKSYDIIKSYFPKSILVYDAEALFSTREILKAKVKGFDIQDDEIEIMRRKEFGLMKKADLIVTVSENEKSIINKNGISKNIATFGHSVSIQDAITGFDSRKDLLFVGSFLAPEGPNDDAIFYFIKKIWPTVKEALSCKLYIVGINPPDSIKKLSSSSIIITGYVKDLDDYYKNARIFIVPHRYAAGIPLKLVEAMSYGIPSVVSEIIAGQINVTDGQEVLVGTNPGEFSQKIITLYKNSLLWEKIQRNSLDFVIRNFGEEKCRNDIQLLISEIEGQIKK